ncbi:MAG TPA: general stress protein [Lacisediminihabitans sp.]|uniref:general stress protein n=1 Tax=Lacisediminihabitans sp. TaxID=2787631 RepID=UPI002ED9DC39
MTNQGPMGARARLVPTLPKGDVLGTYDTYFEAQAVVDRLAKADFEVKQVSIVGSDLKTVERVTGKLTYGRAAGAGAASGAWFGLFLGVLLTFSSSSSVVQYVFAAIIIGAGFGALFGIAATAINRRTRDFTSTHQVLASKYEVIIDPQLTMKAQDVLARPDSGRN